MTSRCRSGSAVRGGKGDEAGAPARGCVEMHGWNWTLAALLQELASLVQLWQKEGS